MSEVSGGQLAAVDDDARRRMLEALRAGDAIELQVDAVTYIQRKGPNRNYVRFAPKMLASFAKSFIGQPMLRDHASYSLEDRGGTITDAKLERSEGPAGETEYAIRMTLRLVKAWAVEGALDGTLDRFSIGWSRTGIVECSIHGDSVRECGCWPGDMVNGARAEWVFTAAEGTEVSAVNVPAVVGTGIDGISQLSALDRTDMLRILGSDSGFEEEPIMDPKLIAALGLKPDAKLEDVLAAIAKEKEQSATVREQLAVAQGIAKDQNDRLSSLEAAHLEREKRDRVVLVDGKLAALRSAGKLKPKSEVEASLRRLADRDLESFIAACDDLLKHGASVTPVGRPPVALTADGDPPEHSIDESLAENPHLAPMLRKSGLTKEQYTQFGARARAKLSGNG